MKLSLTKVFLLLSTTLFSASCATFLTGTRDGIHISSTPQGAKVVIDGKDRGVTPVNILLKRSIKSKQVELKGIGSEKKITLEKKLNKITIVGVLWGWIVDAITGSTYKYSPTYYEVNLSGETNKKKYYNLSDNFFVITFKGDTFYCQEKINRGLFSLDFKLTDGKPMSVKKADVFSYKCLEISRSTFLIINLSKSIEVSTYENRPHNPKKPESNKTFMKVLMQHGEYKLLRKYFSGSGASEYGGGGSKLNYYLFKGDNYVEEVERSNYKEVLKKHFGNSSPLLEALETKGFGKLDDLADIYSKDTDKK